MPTAAERWAVELSAWAIPPEILAQAPEDPWAHSPGLFTVPDPEPTADTPTLAAARAALGSGGTVLDVGCGTGAASLPLVPQARHITGVDERTHMLVRFEAIAAERGVAISSQVGRWPDCADSIDQADVVVCAHVVYNVVDISAFVVALVAHARRAVVIELTERHPQSSMAALWRKFWGLDRPSEPSAGLLLEVVRELGLRPEPSWRNRPARRPPANDTEYVALVRRRLCLPAARDREVAEALGAAQLDADRVATVVIYVR